VRYIGGVISSVEPEVTSSNASGVFTLNDYAQKLSASNLPVPQLGIQFIMVGGGGAGSPGNGSRGGGGGAGGVLESLDFSFKINRGVNYTIQIGAGGGVTEFVSGTNGTNTEAFGLSALGGGRGAISQYNVFAGSGGSGGGTSHYQLRGGFSIQEAPNGVGNVNAFGNHGGGFAGRPNVSPANSVPGGGGGAGEQGNTDGIYQGGDGKSNTVFKKADGTTFYGEDGIYAGGGGGAFEATTAAPTSGIGGLGGGGDTSYKLNMGFGTAGNTGVIFDYHVNGLPNTGGGGGGDFHHNSVNYNPPGNGGSGILIVRYPDNFPAAVVTGSPEIVNANGHRQYAFLASGTFKVD
tara:strand:- start:6710 stop:7756 length:1047 start_codon:yes stop_codon:yes gene_type:complete